MFPDMTTNECARFLRMGGALLLVLVLAGLMQSRG
jgi:hypothetical protein